MWLLVQCGRPQTECRHKAMELFYEFVPLLPGILSHSALLSLLPIFCACFPSVFSMQGSNYK